MFLSFRARLFALSVLLLAIFLGVLGLYLHQTLRDWTETRIQNELEDQAVLIAHSLNHVDDSVPTAEFIDSLDLEADPRITLVDADGVVLADTDLTPQQLVEVENHIDRPEVRDALGGATGYARRHSESVGTDLLYVAVPAHQGDTVVRLSLPLRDVDEALGHLRLLLLVGGLFGLGIAVVMSSVASNLMSRTLQNMLERARARQESTPDGDIEEVSNSLHDVTERLEDTMATLSTERDRFRAVIDGMSEGVVATDAGLEVTLSNRAASEILAGQELRTGLPVRRWMPEDLAIRLRDEALDEGTASADFELSDPASRCIHVRATRRPDSSGFVFVFHDVTTLRRLETMRRDFVANVSHELRTPVSVIQANAETLLDGALESPEHAQSFTDSIYRHSERLSRLISDLLDISRIESGERDFDLQPLHVATFLERAVENVECGTATEASRFEVDAESDLVALADAGAVDQILVNLCENAVKYDASDETITLRARQRDDEILIEVCDRGSGVDEEHRHRLFERFYRVDPGRSAEVGGTGLGLSIVKHLVTSMGGSVGYRPRDGGGSVFWFALPSDAGSRPSLRSDRAT